MNGERTPLTKQSIDLIFGGIGPSLPPNGLTPFEEAAWESQHNPTQKEKDEDAEYELDNYLGFDTYAEKEI